MKLVFDECSKPEWFESIGREIDNWYECSIIALEDLQASDELTIKYAKAPPEWDKKARQAKEKAGRARKAKDKPGENQGEAKRIRPGRRA